MKRFLSCLFLLTLVSLSCGQSPGVPSSTPASSASPVNNPGISGQFTIAIEYGILGVAQSYQSTGVTYAKLQDVFAMWGNIEPIRDQYSWGPTDAIVTEYQQAGFTGLQLDISALSPWAASKPPAAGNKGDAFPKPEYLGDYAAFVKTLVERYDGDGLDDMPGLLYPIHDWGIEREFTGYWPGSAEEYIQLLRTAYPAIKSADPQARVLLVALLMADVFDGDPNHSVLEKRLATPVDYMRKSVSEIKTILAACDSYDMVDFHSLGNYTEIPPTTLWIREQLKASGCPEKPIWIGDAFPMSGLVGYGGFVPPTPFSPVTLATRDDMVALLKEMADPADDHHGQARDWMYAETAINLVRKAVASAGEGLLGINLGNLEDWKTGLPAVDKITVPMLGASMFMGLTDTTITTQIPGGNLPFNGVEWSKARRVGEHRPGFYALGLVTHQLQGFTSVTRLDLGKGVWVYRFERPQGPVWVLWYDDGSLVLPGMEPPQVTINLPFPGTIALLTLTPTRLGVAQPEVQSATALSGSLELILNSVPVFVEVVN